MPNLEDELRLEMEYKEEGRRMLEKHYQNAKGNGTAAETPLGSRMMVHLYDTLAENLNDFMETTLTPKRGVKPGYTHLVKWLAEVYKGRERDLIALLALSTMSQAINAIFVRALGTSNIARLIVSEVIDEANLQAYYNDASRTDRDMMARGIEQRKSRFYRAYYARQSMAKSGYKEREWDREDTTRLGAKLIDILVHSSDFFEYFNTVAAKGSAMTELHPTQQLLDTWTQNENYLLTHAHKACPMIIPPDPWTNYKKGGYYGELQHYYSLLRLNPYGDTGINSFYKGYIKRLNQLDIDHVLTAINAIQATPWMINKKVLDIAKTVIAQGGERAGLPRMQPYDPLPHLNDPTEEQLKAHKKRGIALAKAEASRKGKALRMLAHIKTAEKYKDYEQIYFPHNMDFRGRVYPIPSFSPQGDDLNKGLLLFSDVPPCQDMEAIKWLAVTGSNFAGVDKVSFDERVKWVETNERNILDTAEDPMGMIDWWGELDAPWEFLAWCFEWERWKEWEEEHQGDPRGFQTGIPCAFDGTCSGLQHFSAALRDEIGAKEVNLLPGDAPRDIYGRVAAIVNDVLDRDAMDGTLDAWSVEKERVIWGTKTLAQLWKAHGVDRKVTKRSVMTLAYGSKQYGFRDQILEDTITPHKGDGIWNNENANQAAGYMAKLIWEAVRKVVVKAVEGMEWLQKVAREVCKAGNVVTWTTPMGLLVQQTYLKYDIEIYRMRFSHHEKRYYAPRETGEINVRRQSQGIAPNFIHSMDASHLQLTTLTAYKDHGITHFAMIHDSYGTTIAQAGDLFHVIRQCFVKMYIEHDVLAAFKKDMEMLTDAALPPIPQKGQFEIKEVLDSLYAFH